MSGAEKMVTAALIAGDTQLEGVRASLQAIFDRVRESDPDAGDALGAVLTQLANARIAYHCAKEHAKAIGDAHFALRDVLADAQRATAKVSDLLVDVRSSESLNEDRDEQGALLGALVDVLFLARNIERHASDALPKGGAR